MLYDVTGSNTLSTTEQPLHLKAYFMTISWIYFSSSFSKGFNEIKMLSYPAAVFSLSLDPMLQNW